MKKSKKAKRPTIRSMQITVGRGQKAVRKLVWLLLDRGATPASFAGIVSAKLVRDVEENGA